MKTALTFIFYLLLGALPVAAADGDLDLTFNSTGFRVTDFSTAAADVGYDIFVQPDGRIVALGAGNGQHAAVRYNANGTLDTTFSGDGLANALTGSATAGALQPDGKLLVGAAVAGGSVSVVRFNADGTLDTAFDGDGQAVFGFGGTNTDTINSLLVRPDGKIVVAATRAFSTGDLRDIALARLNADGSLDPSFDDDGRLIVNLTPNAVETVGQAVLQADGKIVVAGQKNGAGGFADFYAARFNPDGTLDPSFDGDGWRSIPVAPADNDLACCVALAPGGRIVVAGFYNDAFGQRLTALVRLNADGSFDNSFDGDGLLTGLGIDLPQSLLVQPDGRPIVGGVGSTNLYTLLKRTANGAADTSFSLDGQVNGSGTAQALALQPDGRLLVTGSRVVSGANTAVFTARYQNSVAAVPTAAGVAVGGRVLGPNGDGVRGARVILQDQNGNLSSRSTNSFGFFRFDGVAAGQTCVVWVESKEYVFDPQVVSVIDELVELEFRAVGTRAGRTR